MEADYVVVGAGAAGCVVASRLSADPGRSVLLVEYGGRPVSPLIDAPEGFHRLLEEDRYLYRYGTSDGDVWLRGRVLGGSTAVNGMMWTRGAPADWDALAARGNPGWAWDDIAPAYRALERALAISVPPAGEVTQAILGSGRSYGWRLTDDFNSLDTERIGPTPSSIAAGKRVTAYSALIRSAENRSNLTVATRARAARLLFDGRRVTGVRAGTTDIMARKEVVVCAGAIETPLLLERSGIGRADIIRSLGVPLAAESPNVGERLLEHRGLALRVRLKRERPVSAKAALAKTVSAKEGPATAGYDVLCQFKSSPALARPDVHGIFAPDNSGIFFLGYPIRPGTRGSVHASGADPADPPVINARFLETESDRNAAAPVLDTARAVLGQGPAAELIASEDFPGAAVTGPERTVRYSRQSGGGLYHAVGSAAMGPATCDVTDSRLRVRGIAGLRIADASVLPAQVAGGTAAPAMAVGWRAADLILEDFS